MNRDKYSQTTSLRQRYYYRLRNKVQKNRIENKTSTIPTALVARYFIFLFIQLVHVMHGTVKSKQIVLMC